jgi:hypothetical protein
MPMQTPEITLNDNIIEYGVSANDTPGFSMSVTGQFPAVYSAASSITIVPDSFLKGLADCDAGRVVDMEKAMEEPPPDCN